MNPINRRRCNNRHHIIFKQRCIRNELVGDTIGFLRRRSVGLPKHGSRRKIDIIIIIQMSDTV